MAASTKKRGTNFGSKDKKQNAWDALELPTIYKIVAKILRKVDAKKGTIKNLIYSHAAEVRGNELKKLYALVYESLRYKLVLSEIVKEINLFEKEKVDIYLTWVLIYELLFGKKVLPGHGKEVNKILKYKSKLQEALKKYLKENSVTSAEELVKDRFKLDIPRYARINTLLTTVSDVLRKLKEDGYQHVQYQKEEITLDKYYDLVKELQSMQFIQDYHFEDLLVFEHKENLAVNPLYKNNNLLLQDKTSYLAAKMLSPPANSFVLDSCAAPGIKTIQLATSMQNTGKLYANDKNGKRLTVLKNLTSSAGVENIIPSGHDFTKILPENSKFSDVEYILLDPSCSGTGIANRMDEVIDDDASKSEFRIKKLSIFQKQMLKHALNFPKVKRVVYSTCSINAEENEEVIKDAIDTYKENFHVVEAFPEWPLRGKQEYEFGKFCLRADPSKTLTNGFFIAIIERIEKSEDDLLHTMSSAEEKDEVQCIKKSSKKKRKLMNDSKSCSKTFRGIKTNNFRKSLDGKTAQAESAFEQNDDNDNINSIDEEMEIYSDSERSASNTLKRNASKKKTKTAVFEVNKADEEMNSIVQKKVKSSMIKKVLTPMKKVARSKLKIQTTLYEENNDEINSSNENDSDNEEKPSSPIRKKMLFAAKKSLSHKKKVAVKPHEDDEIDDDDKKVYSDDEEKAESPVKRKTLSPEKKVLVTPLDDDDGDGEIDDDDEEKAQSPVKRKTLSPEKKVSVTPSKDDDKKAQSPVKRRTLSPEKKVLVTPADDDDDDDNGEIDDDCGDGEIDDDDVDGSEIDDDDDENEVYPDDVDKAQSPVKRRTLSPEKKVLVTPLKDDEIDDNGNEEKAQSSIKKKAVTPERNISLTPQGKKEITRQNSFIMPKNRACKRKSQTIQITQTATKKKVPRKSRKVNTSI